MNLTDELVPAVQALGRDGRKQLVFLSILILLGAVAEAGSLIALFTLLRRWLTAGNEGTTGLAAGLFAATIIGAGLLRYLILAATQKLAFDTGHRLLVAVQRRILARPWLDHVAERAATPLAAVERVDMVVHGILLPLLQGAAALVLAAAVLLALLVSDPLVAFAAFALIAGLSLLANSLFRDRFARAGDQVGRGIEARISAIQNQFGAMRALILAGGLGHAAADFRKIDRRLATAKTEIAVANGGPRIFVETFGLLALAGLAWAVALRSGGLGQAVPLLATLAFGVQRMLPLAQTMSQATSGLVANRGVLGELNNILARPDLPEIPSAPALPFVRDLRLVKVSFRYPSRAGAAVDHIDLTIKRGERIALMGPNGSGKSTLADLIMGLIEPDSGQIEIDGRPLSHGQLTAWRRNVAHVPQSPFLLDSSIIANVAFPEAVPNADRVAEAIRLVGMTPLIATLDQGLDTRVGERGLMLSGGQRQRLALARAFYAPAPLLVMDEATNALDQETEREISAALDGIQERGTTIILIAHRSSLLTPATRIVRLAAGRIVDDQTSIG